MRFSFRESPPVNGKLLAVGYGTSVTYGAAGVVAADMAAGVEFAYCVPRVVVDLELEGYVDV